MPRYKEFSLKDMMEEIKKDEEVIDHLHDLETAKAKHKATFMMTVLATLKPNFVR